jgi:putative alpha-1,2-mannosidase
LHQVLERYLDRRLPSVLNGKSLDIPVITHTQIRSGGKIEFVMGRQPSNWAANWRATPLAQQKSD